MTEKSLLSPYRILSRTPEFFLLQHTQTLQKAFYKEFFGSRLTEAELSLISENLARRKALSSPNLLQIYDFSVTQEQKDFKFGLIYEHWLQSFAGELLGRRGTNNYWSEEELLNTLEAVVLGVWTMHSNGITHGNITAGEIVVTGDGFVKLADQFVTSSCYKKSFEQIMREQKGYFGPETVNSGRATVNFGRATGNSGRETGNSAGRVQWIESQEADLWAVGMVFLEAAGLRDSDECLDWWKGEIRWEAIEERMGDIARVYGEGRIIEVLKVLLNERKEKRKEVFKWFGLEKEGLLDKIEEKKEELSPKFKKNEVFEELFETHRKSKIEFVSYLRNEIRKREKSLERLGDLLREAEKLDDFNEENTKKTTKTSQNNYNNNNYVLETRKPPIDPKSQEISQKTAEITQKSFDILKTLRPPSEVRRSSDISPPKQQPEPHTKRSSLSLIKDKYSVLMPNTIVLPKPLPSPHLSDKFADFSIIKTEDDPALTTSFDSKPCTLNSKATHLKDLNRKLEDCLQRSRSVSPSNSIDYTSIRSNTNKTPNNEEKRLIDISNIKQQENNFENIIENNVENIENNIENMENNFENTENNLENIENTAENIENTPKQQLEKPKIKKLLYENGDYYEGEVLSDVIRTGYGSLYNREGRLIYQGEWRNNLFHGHGVKFNLTITIGEFINGFPYQDFNKVRGNWIKYEGGWKEGKRHGSGALIISSKEVFQGVFKEDKVWGKGSFQGNRGRVIGEWKENKLVHKIN